MKKIAIITTLILIASKISFSQANFSHAIGIGLYNCPAIIYSPRINFAQIRIETTLSIGTHLAYGYKPDKYLNGHYSVYEIPIVMEMNMGCGSSPSATTNYGGFIGVGYAFNKMEYINDNYKDINNSSGIYFNFGIRTTTKKNYMRLGVRFSYLKNIISNNSDVFGISIFYRL